MNTTNTTPTQTITQTIAQKILEIIFTVRNAPAADATAESIAEGLSYHLGKVAALVEKGAVIEMVLPAFPAKSANPEKTTGTLPDLGELLAMRRLEALCVAIDEVYAPGARVVICSDGRVFSDLVGVTDADVTAYGQEIARMIADEGLSHLTTYDMDDLFPGVADHDLTRHELVTRFAESLDVVRERAAGDADARRMYNGIARFMFEDLVVLHPEMSRTKVRNWSAQLAYQVIQRSNAWSNLVAAEFPEAVRLSIHPQAAHSRKIGVQMVASSNLWRTPWHASVLFDGREHTLVRRAEAEARGAILVKMSDRYAYFVLPGALPGSTNETEVFVA